MKCGRKTCAWEALDGRHYCSKRCAQLDVDSGEDSDSCLESETEQFSSKDDGEPCPESSSEENRTEIESEERPEAQIIESDSSATIIETRSESQSDSRSSDPFEPQPRSAQSLREDLITSGKIMPSTERRGTTGMQETKNDTAETRSIADGKEIQATDSKQQLMHLREGILQSRNLIRDCAQHTLDLMKSIGDDAVKDCTLRDFRKINSIAGLAREVANLAKVELEAIKIAKDLRE